MALDSRLGFFRAKLAAAAAAPRDEAATEPLFMAIAVSAAVLVVALIAVVMGMASP
jgi:hypothetical protein